MTSSSYKDATHFLSVIILRISVMDCYITSELVGPFLFGVGTFSSIGVAIGSLFELVREITDSGLPIAIALKVLLLQMPYFISLALPTATLLATLIGYSRLSSDSELIALRSCGISIHRLVLPALIASTILTGVNFTFNELVVPAARFEAAITLERALKKEKPSFRESNIFYPEYGKIKRPDGKKLRILTRLFYAEQFDGQQMSGLTIIDRSHGQLNQIIVSESAAWNPTENIWDFFNGTIYIVDPKGSYRQIVKFDRQQLQLPRAPLDLAARSRDYGEMNIAQSRAYLKIIQTGGNEKKIIKLKIRIQQRYALPFACIAFGLIGAALGIQQHTSRGTGFGISVLAVFIYYMLMSIGDALGLSSIITPWMAGWLPTTCAFGVGILLLLRQLRDSSAARK